MCTPSQWEKTLQCNATSHWPGACTKWSLLIRQTGRLKIECTERGALKPKFLNEWMNEWKKHFGLHTLRWSRKKFSDALKADTISISAPLDGAIRQFSGVILLMKNSVPPLAQSRACALPTWLRSSCNSASSFKRLAQQGSFLITRRCLLGYFEDSFKVFAFFAYAASGWSFGCVNFPLDSSRSTSLACRLLFTRFSLKLELRNGGPCGNCGGRRAA